MVMCRGRSAYLDGFFTHKGDGEPDVLRTWKKLKKIHIAGKAVAPDSKVYTHITFFVSQGLNVERRYLGVFPSLPTGFDTTFAFALSSKIVANFCDLSQCPIQCR